MRTKDRNQPKFNLQEVYNHLHKEHLDYGNSPHRLFEFVKILQPLNFNSMLDVGCGSGQLLKWIKHTRPHVHCHGVDFCQTALDKVKVDSIELKLGQAQQLPYEDDQFDLVVCTHVLDRIPEPDTHQAIAELKRVGVGWIWIQVSDCDGTEEDKLLKKTPYDKMRLLTTRRSIHWWQKNFERQKLVVHNKQQDGKKISYICHVSKGLLG